MSNPNINLFKIDNRDTQNMCKTCSKFTIKIPEGRHWRHSGVFIVKFEYISHLFLKFLLLTLSMQMIFKTFPKLTFTVFNILFKNYFVICRIKIVNSKWKKIAHYCISLPMFKVNNKDTRTKPGVVLVSLMLFLNLFHTLF